MSRASRNRKSWTSDPAERNDERYDLSASWREPKSARAFLRAAENAAIRREERRQARQRALACVGLTVTAAGLLVLSALVPGKAASAKAQEAFLPSAQPAAEVFAESGSGRKAWCYTFLILRRDEEAEKLEGAAIGMLDRKEKTLALVTVPETLLVETVTDIRTLGEVYADKGAYGVRDQIARLLGYPVDHYVSLSSETAADIFALLDGENVFFPPAGEQSGAWCAVLENTLSAGYIRNRDGVISLLAGECSGTLTAENLRWYARELLKLGSGSVNLYSIPAVAASAEAENLAVCREEWLELLNESLDPYYETITNENIRAVAEEQLSGVAPAR